MSWIISVVAIRRPFQSSLCQFQHYSVYEVVQMSLLAINLLVFGCRAVKKLFDADGFAGRSIVVKWHARTMLATYNSSAVWELIRSFVELFEYFEVRVRPILQALLVLHGEQVHLVNRFER